MSETPAPAPVIEPSPPPSRPPRRRITSPTILQMEAVECGAAALAMVLAHYGRWVPLEELRHECGVSRDGSKASNMLQGRAQVRPRGRRATSTTRSRSSTSCSLPVILFWNFNHFVVLEGFKGARST